MTLLGSQALREGCTSRMPKRKLMHRLKAPSVEVASMLAEKGFLLLSEVSKLSGVDEDTTTLMIRQFGLKPYMLETVKGGTVNGYMTNKIKKMLAARGRIVPGFNEGLATQRQWLEVLDSAIDKPLDKDWYFPPVNPDPLVVIDKDRARHILEKIQEYAPMEGDPEEVLRLISDTINTMSRDDMPLRSNSKWKNAGGGLFARRK